MSDTRTGHSTVENIGPAAGSYPSPLRGHPGPLGDLPFLGKFPRSILPIGSALHHRIEGMFVGAAQ